MFNDNSQGERTIYSSGTISYLKFMIDNNTLKGKKK